MRAIGVILMLMLMLALAASSAQAGDEVPDTVQDLRAELERLKGAQAARTAEMQKLEERLAALEASAEGADASFSGANDPADWLNRLRVNFQVGF